MTRDEAIINELIAATTTYPEWAGLAPMLAGPSVGVHLAVMVEPFLTLLLDGRKTIESRFSKNAIQPYRQVAVGDLVLLKAGPVVGSFVVSSVDCQTLAPGTLPKLRTAHARAICADDDEFWNARADKRYVTLTGVSDVRSLPPVTVPKKDMRGWVVLRPATGRTLPEPALW